MLFQKFIEQHRVYRFVADGHDFSIFAAHYQIRINLLYFFSYQAELWNTVWINILFVAERHWCERKYRFARLVHGLDVLLEAGRGGGGTELTVRVYYHGASTDRRPEDAGN